MLLTKRETKVGLYIYNQMKKGKFIYWDENTIELDGIHLFNIIDNNKNLLNYYMNNLSKSYSNDMSFTLSKFIELNLNNSSLSLSNYIYDIYSDDDYSNNTIRFIIESVSKMFLTTLYEYFTQCIKLSDLEINSIILFDRNFFENH